MPTKDDWKKRRADAAAVADAAVAVALSLPVAAAAPSPPEAMFLYKGRALDLPQKYAESDVFFCGSRLTEGMLKLCRDQFVTFGQENMLLCETFAGQIVGPHLVVVTGRVIKPQVAETGMRLELCGGTCAITTSHVDSVIAAAECGPSELALFTKAVGGEVAPTQLMEVDLVEALKRLLGQARSPIQCLEILRYSIPVRHFRELATCISKHSRFLQRLALVVHLPYADLSDAETGQEVEDAVAAITTLGLFHIEQLYLTVFCSIGKDPPAAFLLEDQFGRDDRDIQKTQLEDSGAFLWECNREWPPEKLLRSNSGFAKRKQPRGPIAITKPANKRKPDHMD